MKAPGRRLALRALGAAGLAPALSACSRGASERLIPYVVPPDDVVPGLVTEYATTCRECPAGCGLWIRTREGRAIKAEGNPEHPVNRGALCIRGQASLQGLYDPDRIASPLRATRRSGSGSPRRETLRWADALAALVRALRDARPGRVAFVTPLLSGSLDALIDRWLGAIGGARRLRYEPFAYEPIREASRIAFGRATIPDHDFAAARMIVSFGADFLETWLSNVAHARGLRAARSAAPGARARFVHLESRRSLTASSADEWLSVVPGTEGLVALAMAHTILADGLDRVGDAAVRARLTRLLGDKTAEVLAPVAGLTAERVRGLARRFAAAEPGLAIGGGVAVAGSNATAMQVAIHLLNLVAGNLGRSVVFGRGSAYDRASSYGEMAALVESMRAGEVDLLLVADANPAFALPAALGFADALRHVKTVVSFSAVLDETAALADLLLPTHTPLEAWGDHEPVAGVHGLQQPVVTPVFDTRHLGDVLIEVARDLGEPAAARFPHEDFSEFLRERWRELQQGQPRGQDFEAFWAEALRRGGVWRPAAAEPVTPDFAALGRVRFEPPRYQGRERPFTLVLYPSLHHYDGRGANRPWLHEIPEPVSKAAWGQWAEIHPDTCRGLGLTQGQVVALESDQGTIELPALPSDGVRPGVVAVPLGQGHWELGRHARGRGPSPLRLLGSEPEADSLGLRWLSARVSLAARAVWRPLAIAQASFDQQGRGIARAVAAGAATQPVHGHDDESSLYPEHTHAEHRWGMAIDLDACIGCNACVAACYAENNVPVVGAEAVLRGREMAWLRLERYVEPDAAGGDVRFVPMLCQHCDHAPCESVCPVYATYHNPEGLNAQVYNRCVGTRYCANNCPYKVRRFNWLDPEIAATQRLQLNPDVTVRSKGVMEKCTFCVQRIQAARGRAKDEARPLRDGDVTPACAQTCPTAAIRFGDLLDPAGAASRLARDPRAYRVFEGLNTRPAVSYLAKVRS